MTDSPSSERGGVLVSRELVRGDAGELLRILDTMLSLSGVGSGLCKSVVGDSTKVEEGVCIFHSTMIFGPLVLHSISEM